MGMKITRMSDGEVLDRLPPDSFRSVPFYRVPKMENTDDEFGDLMSWLGGVKIGKDERLKEVYKVEPETGDNFNWWAIVENYPE